MNWREGQLPQSSLLYPGLCSLDLSRRVFVSESNDIFHIFTAAKPLSMLEWMVTTCFGFNCKQRVECRVTPTNRACWFPSPQLRILGKIATKFFPTQDTDPLAIGAKNFVHYIAYNEDTSNWYKNDYISTVSFDKTSARPPHLVQVLTLPPDDILRQLKKPEESFERALISPLKREPASCSRRIETGKPWTREKLARGRRRFQFFGYRS